MYKDLKWLRLTPDRPGRGGTKTGIHSFQQQPVNDVRSLVGGHVYQGAWRKEYAATAYPQVQALPVTASQPLALHVYVYPSETDPSALPNATALSHQLEQPANASYIRDVVGGGIRMGPRIITAPPAIFQNINGRCFAVEGTGEGMIFDDRTPAIHAQPNQSIGIGTPLQALQKSAGNGISPYGTGYCYSGSHYITHPNPDNMLSTIVTTDNVAISTPNISYGQYGGVAIVTASPSSDGVTSNTVPFTATGGLTIDPAVNPSLITLTGGATWPAAFAYCGLAVNFGGLSFVILGTGDGATTIYDINGNGAVLTTAQAYILGVYDGPALTAVPYTITGCRLLMPGAASGLTMSATGTLGYSQTTRSNLVQVQLLVLRANGLFRNLGNISLGTAGKNVFRTTNNATMSIGDNNLYENPAIDIAFEDADVDLAIIVDQAGTNGGTAGITQMLQTTISSVLDPTNLLLSTPNQSGAYFNGALAVWGSHITGISDANVTIGGNTLTSATNPWTVANIGNPIIIAGIGNAAGTQAVLTTITGFTGPGTVTVGVNALATVGGLIAGQAFWQDQLASTTLGPTYAYAWYDPETGHCSNISPLFQIPKPTIPGQYQDFANVTPVFRVDPGYISYPSTTDAVRFSHILFFRTLSGGNTSTLYPIGSLNPFVGKVHPGGGSTRGSWGSNIYHGWMGLPNNYVDAPPSTPANVNIWYDFSSDSDLLLSGGFRAPQETNSKPIALIRGGATQPGYPFAQAYWDRRTWMICTQDPHAVIFSCDEAQCPLGIPEESFPPTNRLQIPAEDSAGVSLKTVGDTLILTTQHWAYMIVGNNESNYRLMKVSAGMAGVGYYQMDEFPTYTGAEGEPSTLFYLGRDRKVYQWTFGANVIPISQPIQDQLDTVLKGNGLFTPLLQYQLSRLHCVSAWGRRLVVVAPNAGSYNEVPPSGPTQVHFYDIDNQIWSEGFHPNASHNAQDGLAPMTTVYGLELPSNELFSIYDPALNRIVVQSWIRDDTSGTPNYMTITTFPINFDGKKTRKQIVSMNLHATGGSWTGGMFVDEATTAISATFGAYPDPLYSIYAPVATPVDPGAQDIVVMGAQFTNQAPVVGHRFSLVVQKNADSNPAKVYALDIAYIDYTDPGEGEP